MSALSKIAAGHCKRGEFEQADLICREILARDSGNADAWHIRGITAIQARAFARATEYLLRAIFHKPDDYAMHVNLGIALLAQDRLDEAVAALRRSTELDPSKGEGFLCLAKCHFARGEDVEAETAANKALAIRADWPEAVEMLATVVQRLGRNDEALDLALRALSLEANRASSHRVAGDVYTRRGDYAIAQKHYEAALRADPENGEARSNFALLLARLGLHEEAVEAYRVALAKIPNDAATRHGLSQTLLALGQFEEAWPLYAARLHLFGQTPRHPAIPRLERLPNPGERILAHGDQGPGEQVMFASLIPDLLRTGADLFVECDTRLVKLFERSFPGARFVADTAARNAGSVGDFDAKISLPDTARWLRTDWSSFPRHRGFLRPLRDLQQQLRTDYQGARTSQPLVGISWRTSQGAKISEPKTILLAQWAPLLCVPGITFVNLQYGECSEEIAAVSTAFGVKIINDARINPLLDFDAFAAQVAAMDLVITTSNTTAHFAGALNVPTWAFIPMGFGGIWHWFLGREDSPWYPSVRLIRQISRREWQPALDTASMKLVDFTAGWAAKASHG